MCHLKLNIYIATHALLKLLLENEKYLKYYLFDLCVISMKNKVSTLYIASYVVLLRDNMTSVFPKYNAVYNKYTLIT